jgi:meso-butanediol dehydrogenase/(S,S)-butanediol dehydrogenase/diacetyl reductase
VDAVVSALADKVVWVVGGGSGLGRAIALEAAREGAVVWLSGRRPEALAETVALGAERGFALTARPCDALSPEEVDATASEITASHGRLDALLLSLGAACAGSLATTPFTAWKRMQESHLDTMFHLCQRCLGPLAAAPDGNIVILGSLFGLVGKKDRLAYCTVKGAVVNFVRAMALDLAGSVRVNSICPGWVATDMSMALVQAAPDPAAALAERAGWHPMGRGGRPEEVAALAVYLASGKAAWMTGQSIALDGGCTAA